MAVRGLLLLHRSQDLRQGLCVQDVFGFAPAAPGDADTGNFPQVFALFNHLLQIHGQLLNGAHRCLVSPDLKDVLPLSSKRSAISEKTLAISVFFIIANSFPYPLPIGVAMLEERLEVIF